MSSSNLLSRLRRSAPPIVKCFRNAELYSRQRQPNEVYPPEVIVLFTWLGAKQKYAHKYAKCWTSRGHDVLHVTTTVRDLLFPKTGAEVTASRVVDFLDRRDKNVIVHGISVGGYLTQRVLMQAKDSTLRVTHQLFDSFTTCSGIEAGVENAVSPKYREIAKKGVKLYTHLADMSSIQDAESFALTTPYPAPIMYMHSLYDNVALYSELEPVIEAAKKVGPVKVHLIPAEDKVPHVTIMKCIGEQKYMKMYYDFIEEHRDENLVGVANRHASLEGKSSSADLSLLS